jgi:hypothetical protein
LYHRNVKRRGASPISMDQRFTQSCEKLFRAVADYILSGLTDDEIYYDSVGDKPSCFRTDVIPGAATMPKSGLPIRGTLGTKTAWVYRISEKSRAERRVFTALADKGGKSYVDPSIPYSSVVESVKESYGELASEIILDPALSRRIFESMLHKCYEPAALDEMAATIVGSIQGGYGIVVISNLIGTALANEGYTDKARRRFSGWDKAARYLAEQLTSLSARTHNKYTIAVLLNAPLLDSKDSIDIATLRPESGPVTLRLEHASDEMISRTSRNNAQSGTINSVLAMPIQIGVNESIERYLLAYQFAEFIAQKAVDILRLVSADDIGVLGVELIREDLMTPSIERTWESSYDQQHSAFYPKRFKFTSPTAKSTLSEGEIEAIRRLAERHIMNNSKVPGWDIAMRRFRDVYERYTPDDPEIILAMAVAFEALYLNDIDSKQELGFRLSLRAARFLRDDTSKRNEVFSLVKGLYDLRSLVAHGCSIEALKGKDRNKLNRVRAECPSLLKETLIAVLEGKGPWSEESKEKRTQAWRNIELA